ncbi:winged helix-turn-helix transcriptional regulator [Kitasatospora sp. NPDC089797]|uniref:winged helix-turn-helix transcriptional regulator n=1 Tax=Kitasatospora sp. NPDC089797 TaxID=3155298 RepID=UPI003420B320
MTQQTATVEAEENPVSRLPSPEWAPALTEVVTVPVAALLPADSPRARGEDPEHLRTLAELGRDLPPIIVHRSSMRVVDGMHRLRVAAAEGRSDIPVRFFEGSERDAFVLSVQSNTRHGLPLSKAERTAAAGRILVSHADWADRMIAEVTGLSTKTVRALRRDLGEAIPHPASRIGRDGRARPLDSATGRLRASELITANPRASLRAIADEAGISPGTVRDVRERLRRGEDPLPAGRRPAHSAAVRPAPLPVPAQSPAHSPSPSPAEPRAADRRGATTAQQVGQDLARTMERLMSDPALRLTESGRHLLRMLTSSLPPTEQRDQLVRSVPPHCAGRISQLALECAAAWQEFARLVETARPDLAPDGWAAAADRATAPARPHGPGRADVPAA